MDWIHLTHDRDHSGVLMEFRVLRNFAKIFSRLETGGFSRRSQLHGNSYLYVLTHIQFS
jgi:hypothetical protein